MSEKTSNKIYHLYFTLTIMIIGIHSMKIGDYHNLSFFSKTFYDLMMIVFNMGVPTFFFLSAILLFDKRKDIRYLDLIRKKTKTLLIPYLLWNLLSAPFKMLKSYMNNGFFEFDFLSFIKNIIFSQWDTVLWFVGVLYIYVLLYPIIHKIVKYKKVSLCLIIILIFINIVIGPTTGYSTCRYWLPIYMFGAYLGYNHRRLILNDNYYFKNKFIYLVILLVQSMLIIAAHVNPYALYICRMVSPLFYWVLSDVFLSTKKVKWCEKQTFFYYSSQLFIANYVFIIYKKIMGDNDFSLIFGMFILPFVILVVLMIAAYILNKYFNGLYRILTGSRGESMNKKKELRKMKICLVGSSGGHLTHLYMLKPTWENKERFWVTFDKTDANSLLKDEKVYHCYFPTNRNIKNLIKNTFLAMKILKKEKPDIIISSGAAVAVPFFYLGKLRGAKTVYIEVFDRIDKSTLTGKLVYPVTDKFIVQWDEMKKVYKKSINLGSIF